MAYSPTSTGQNRALVIAMSQTIDRFESLQASIEGLLELAAGQGILTGLQTVGTGELAGTETPANVVRDAAVALGSLSALLGGYDTGEQAKLTAFRDSLSVRAIAPVRCSC